MSHKILIDVDGTMADVHTPWLEYVNERYEDVLKDAELFPYIKEDITDWDWGDKAKSVGISLKGGIEIMHRIWEEAWHGIPFTDPSVPRVTKELHNLYGVDIVTANSRWERMVEWCDHLQLSYSRLYHAKNKEQLDYTIYIEDNPELAGKLGPEQVLLLRDQPYNRDIRESERVRRFHTFSEIPYLLKGLR